MLLGIIAEDKSDVAVIRELTRTFVKSRNLGFKHFVGHGCGKLRRKCHAWAENLVRAGCEGIVLVHDLDRNVEINLRQELERAIANVNARSSIVLIPIKEIEAWLLYDPKALRLAFNGHSLPRLVRDPQLIGDPKSALQDVVWRAFKKKYVNTIHNERIAKKIDSAQLHRSTSFRPYEPFLEALKRKLRD